MPQRRIHQLSPGLVNRIAAGEVIERPASVVKELVENALDAGATRINVEIADGGRELIRVIDDGSGIDAQDLPLAFAQHATSKLTSDEDLIAIATLGFRGEALASIGSVSHARILSRTPASDAAWEILNQGGEISDPQAAAGNVGTTIEVRNLFFNTPARRKFIKGTSTEFGYISDIILRLALPHPQVAFKLSHNGRSVLDLPATTAQERLLAAWPDDFRAQHLSVEGSDAQMRLHGLIGQPDLARPTTKYQYIYLNGRHIRDKFIQHAAREAYRGLTEPGRHPALILLLETRPDEVDVNVHPTKAEVRFRDGGRVHGLVMSTIRAKLLSNDLTPNATPQPVDAPARLEMRQQLAEFFKSAPPPVAYVPVAPPPVMRETPASAPAPLIPRTFSRADAAAPAMPVSEPTPEPMPALPLSDAIQLHNSYLVAQTPEGMIIIDQHALHERIMYEELHARVSSGPLESQRLLIPLTLPASARQIALLEQIQPLLQKLGIEVTAIGPDAVAVQAFPTFLGRLDPLRFLQDLLERGEQELLDLHEEELLHELLDMMACRAAVKAGERLAPAEITALLARRDLVERSSNCPHGRPTTLRLTLKDLEKQFKRTGF